MRLLRLIFWPIGRMAHFIWQLLAGRDPEIVLVRHADYDYRDSSATDLNVAGGKRACQLAHVLDDVELSHILVTDAARTQQTAAVVAAATGLTPQVIPQGRDNTVNAANTVREARRHGSTVLIVGHAPTVPRMIRHLTSLRNPPGIDIYDFDNLFVVYRGRLQHLHYGARTASPPAP